MAKPITPRAALMALQQFLTNRTEIPSAHMTVLRDTFGTLRVLALEEQTLGIEQTLSDLALLKDTGDDTASADSKTLDEALTAGRPALPACPVTRQALRKVVGKNGDPDREETKDGIDWAGIGTDWRETAGYAAELGQIETTAKRVPYELRQAAPPPPWPELKKKWVALRDKRSKTLEEAALVARVQARLVFQRKEAPAAAGSSFPETVSPSSSAQVVYNHGSIGQQVNVAHKGGYDRPLPPAGHNPCAGATGPCRGFTDCRYPACVNDAAAPQPEPAQATTTTTTPLVVILNASKDDGLRKDLRGHLSGAVRQEKIVVWDLTDIRPGAVRSDEIRLKLGKAAVVVWLISPALEEDLNVKQMSTMSSQARQVPVLVRACDDNPFSSAVALPRSGKPVAEWSDRDSAWVEVVRGIKAVLRIG